MLNLFFTLTFIAEIIVGCWVISKLKKFDDYILGLNTQVTAYQPILKKTLLDTQIKVHKSMLVLKSVVAFIGRTKGECKKFFSKNLLAAISGLVLKIPFKQVLSILDVIFAIKKLLKV